MRNNDTPVRQRTIPFVARWWCGACFGAATLCLLFLAPAQSDDARFNARIDRSLQIAARYLVDRQQPDGAWRSDHYSAFRDGTALTGLVLTALLDAPGSEDVRTAIQKGAQYLAGFVTPEGKMDASEGGLVYPVYTAAFATSVLSHPSNAEHRPARDAWLRFLRERQLTERLGWQPPDRAYGGWGFSADLPRKPADGEPVPPLTESNLSATVFALSALRAAGCPPDDPAIQKALVFVERCQNFSTAEGPDFNPTYDDGGFVFIYDDAFRNKAGVAGTDALGRERFQSYGSTTADGLRALLDCGLPSTHPRVAAARHWLDSNFSADRHPGDYPSDRESARNAVYYYYCYSLGTFIREIAGGESKTQTTQRRDSQHWAELLCEQLLRRQDPRGYWINSAVAMREDDPLVATSLATITLARCRTAL